MNKKSASSTLSLILLLILLLAAILPTTGYSQSVAIPTNAPVVGLDAEQFGLTTSTVTEGEKFRAAVTLDYNVSKHFYVRGEIQSGADNVAIDNLGIGVGFYHTVSAFRFFAGPIVRYNWTDGQFQGLVGAGTAYQPFENGTLAKFSVFSEIRLVTPFNNQISREPPHREFLAGIRYSF